MLGILAGPWGLYIKAALVAAVFFAGWTVNGWRLEASYKDAQLDAMTLMAEKREEAEAKNQTLSAELEKSRNEKRTIYRTVTRQVDRIIDRPVYRNECLDADGLRAVNTALAGKTEAAREPDNPVPATDATFWRRWFGNNP